MDNNEFLLKLVRQALYEHEKSKQPNEVSEIQETEAIEKVRAVVIENLDKRKRLIGLTYDVKTEVYSKESVKQNIVDVIQKNYGEILYAETDSTLYFYSYINLSLDLWNKKFQELGFDGFKYFLTLVDVKPSGESEYIKFP